MTTRANPPVRDLSSPTAPSHTAIDPNNDGGVAKQKTRLPPVPVAFVQLGDELLQYRDTSPDRRSRRRRIAHR